MIAPPIAPVIAPPTGQAIGRAIAPAIDPATASAIAAIRADPSILDRPPPARLEDSIAAIRLIRAPRPAPRLVVDNAPGC